MKAKEFERIAFGHGSIDIPEEVTICPECSSSLWLYVTEYDSETGEPTRDGLEIECTNDADYENDVDGKHDHRWWQSDWQPAFDKIFEWTRRPRPPKGERRRC